MIPRRPWRALLARLGRPLATSRGRVLQLAGGAPDEPDTGDWDALCATPGPHQVFAALFAELAGGLPERGPTETSADDVHRIHTIWFGTAALGACVTETQSAETTAFPMHCRWETFGLPGLKAVWCYSLDRAGQLGYVAFRHGSLTCTFASPADERRFGAIWRRVLDRTARFEPVAERR